MLRAVFAVIILCVCGFAYSEQEPSSVLPALSRQWQGKDYQVVADALMRKLIALPLYSTKEGTAMLQRITAIENLTYQSSPLLPLPPRIQDSLAMQGAVTMIMMQYYFAANNKQDVHGELAAMLSFLIRTSASNATLLKQWVAVMPRDNTYATRMEGLKKVQSGLIQILMGSEASLSERNLYSPTDISLMLEAIADSIGPINEYLKADVRDELRRKFEAHRAEFKEQKDVDNLNRIVNVLLMKADA